MCQMLRTTICQSSLRMYTFPTVIPHVQPRQVGVLASLQRFQLCRHQLKRILKMTLLLNKCPVSHHKHLCTVQHTFLLKEICASSRVLLHDSRDIPEIRRVNMHWHIHGQGSVHLQHNSCVHNQATSFSWQTPFLHGLSSIPEANRHAMISPDPCIARQEVFSVLHSTSDGEVKPSVRHGLIVRKIMAHNKLRVSGDDSLL